ncbi:tetratricopeptide repeat protein [Aquabacterium sp.]|uniref:tetratricopeptide repeat protein n=1 Tax=Aquabacterium sp. TaxID=1872578 RepID=UPI002C1171CE|nr:tetratricopeptide repeat protein [Aquabacterium sp.]HSW06640.1 tetratricopeptide repeat protein [Aquabacterium sp.]
MTLEDSAGHALSGATPTALDVLETALHQFRCFIGDPVASLDAALAAAPELAMGHLFKAWLHLLGTDPAGTPVAQEALRQAQALPMTERERGHATALGHLLQGRWRAAGRTLEDLSILYPLDTLALQAGHQIDFFTGDSRMLHDRIARAMPAWHRSITGYHAVLGMLAFGLEETGRYSRAERVGRQCVELEPRDGWGQHAVAHVLEMQNRRQEGVAWMRGNCAGWSADSFFAVHNWWHLALFHLGQDQIDEVLALVDGPICGGASQVVVDMIDASAMLWRLQLRGVDVGQRWHALAERWTRLAGAGHYAFNDMHAMMAFMGSGRADGAAALLATQAAALLADNDNAGFTRDVGHAATRAIQSHAEGRYAHAVDLLRPVRNIAHRFGGSHAQRDLLDLTLIDAAQRSGQQPLAQALLDERASAQA